MSAYGSITSKSNGPRLPPQYFPAAWDDNVDVAVVHAEAALPGDLVSYLHTAFNDVVDEGKTYPQEDRLTLEAFKAYYMSGDLFLGVVCRRGADIPDFATISGSSGSANTIAGMYYIKPLSNSQLNCNAGFVVVPSFRGKKIGYILARSFLHFAPRLGYRASVFNLVYVNNLASVRLWDQLGFTRAGLIPQAGRLKTGPEGTEEYVDAIVYYKRFDDVER